MMPSCSLCCRYRSSLTRRRASHGTGGTVGTNGMYLCVHRDVHERKRVAMKKAVPFLIVLFVGYYVLQEAPAALSVTRWLPLRVSTRPSTGIVFTARCGRAYVAAVTHTVIVNTEDPALRANPPGIPTASWAASAAIIADRPGQSLRPHWLPRPQPRTRSPASAFPQPPFSNKKTVRFFIVHRKTFFSQSIGLSFVSRY